jgi:phosphatidate cytidylyltransferase
MLNLIKNNPFNLVVSILFCILIFASSIGLVFKFKNNNTIINLNQRIFSWWLMIIFCIPAISFGITITTLFFCILSCLSLREFLSFIPTKEGDKFVLFFSFWIIIPLQFFLILNNWYSLSSILIPTYGFFFLSVVTTFSKDTDNFLNRTSSIQWGVMLCVYGISYIPSIQNLNIINFSSNKNLILYFLIVAQISDVFQYICGKLFGKHSLSSISPNKTWEGLIGGGFCATLIGLSLTFMTPFSYMQSWLLSLVIVITGFFGGFILSAIKRSLSVKDWGNLIPGHGGILDRIDSLALSAPIYFHLIRYLFT